MIKIKDMPVLERPMEKLVEKGADYLSNEELLAILLKNGTKDSSAKEVASRILITAGDITKLPTLTIPKLLEIRGIGPMKAATILACLELEKRIFQTSTVFYQDKITNAKKVYEYFQMEFRNEKQEKFYCLYLDASKKILEKKLLFVGTLTYSIVHPREIFKYAYLNGADSIICVHNHPSGEVFPSKNDIDLTNQLIEIGKLHGICIYDHVIIGKDKYYSFFENHDIK